MRIGVLGAGQLGQMLALAGIPMGFEFHFLADRKAGLIDTLGTFYQYTNKDFQTLNHFLEAVDVVTLETENTDLALAKQVLAAKPLLPNIEALRIAQHRGLEKKLFNDLEIATANWQVIQSLAELENAVQKLGLPLLLKTTTDGYDGKGQFKLTKIDDIATAWQQLGQREIIAETIIPFVRELAQVASVDKTGHIAFYPLVETRHQQGILREAIAPAPNLTEEMSHQAQEMVGKIVEQLKYCGTFTLELFATENELLANEMAPRVHNSGHWTIEGAHTSQFENHLRAISGLPLGSSLLKVPCKMENCLGELPKQIACLANSHTHFHDYGKAPKPLRKIGHITTCYPDGF